MRFRLRFPSVVPCVVFMSAASAGAQQASCSSESNARTSNCTATALTLADAVALAQRQGLSAAASRQGLAAARARDRAFSARLMPQVSLDGDAANYNHAIVPVVQPTGETQFVSQSQNVSSMGLSIAEPVPWLGSTLTVSSYLTRIDVTGSGAGRTYNARPFVIALHQDLFKPRETLWDVRAQDLRADLAERTYLESREDLALNTTSAFFDYYAATVSVGNATTNVAVNDTLYTLNRGRFEVGKIGENDLLQSELQLLRARASLDGAKLERDRSESALRRLINVRSPDTLVVAPPQDVPTIEIDAQNAVRQALQNASVSEQSALDSVNARRAETEARFNNGFNASIIASYGVNQTSSLFGLAYASPLPQQQLQLHVTMPVFQWGAGRADQQAARAMESQVASQSRARREQLAEDARYAALQTTQAQRMLVISAKADTVAKKRFEVAKNRYVIGKIGLSDLFIAQNEKDQALDAYVQALRNYWMSYYRLRRLTLYDFFAKARLQ